MSKSLGPLRREVRGFTLLELLLVLLLLGLAYGLAAPALSNRPLGLEMQTATRQIAAGLRKARSTAIAQQRESVLMINLDTRTFTVTGDPRVYALPKTLDYQLYTADSEVVFERTASIRFYPDGSSTGGRVSTLTPKPGNLRQSIDVDWLTGRAIVL
jgi:general secretion pathway protein H